MRTANFSSSQIYRLMANGRANDSIGVSFYTYVQEKKYEQRLGRPIQKEQNGRAPGWGTFVEQRVFDIIELEYVYQSEKRYLHEELPWSGAADLLTETKVVDVKCPYSILEFCKKADIMILNDLEALKKEYPENYWQLVSNSILTSRNIAELIIYCPYEEELPEIRIMASNSEDSNKLAWINWADNQDLPYLVEGNYYKNLYKMEWEVSEEDKQALYDRVKLASEELNK